MATPFETFVNNEMPKRPWIPVPVGGNLEAGQALVATGVGMETVQKLVQFRDADLVRYIGSEPGDYATIALALASLPSGVNDLSNANEPYEILIRPYASPVTCYIEKGTVFPDVNCIRFAPAVLTTSQSTVIIMTTGTLVNDPFYIKWRANPTNTASAYIMFQDVAITTLISPTFVADDGVDFDAILIERTVTNKSYQIFFNSSASSMTISGTYTIAKKFTNVRFLNTVGGAQANVYFACYYSNHFTITQTSTNVLPSGSTVRFLRSDTGLDLILYQNGASMDLNALKTGPLRFSISVNNGVSVVFFDFEYGGLDATSFRSFMSSIINIQFNYTAGVVNKAQVTMFRMLLRDTASPLLTSCIVKFASAHTSGIFDISNVIIWDMIGTARHNVLINNCSSLFPTMFEGSFGGRGTFLRFINGVCRVTGSALYNMDIKSLGNGAILQDGSDFNGNLIGKNLDNNIDTTNYLVDRVANKITQSPLAPVTPQPGDLWLVTEEQY